LIVSAEERQRLQVGNANEDGEQFGGWFIGDFGRWLTNAGHSSNDVSARFGVRNTRRVEVKWGLHPAGQERPNGWSGPGDSDTMSVLISGKFLLQFRESAHSETIDVTLRKQGDYAVWSGEFHHNWRAMDDSVVLTVRWVS
jgi:hypothetical protein